MLELYCESAHIRDGHKVLDLNSGYGAIALHIARKYPTVMSQQSQIKLLKNNSLKNSAGSAMEHNLANVEIILADITTYEMNKEFDRVMVISVFEHLKNYELFLRKTWMKPDGFLFIDHWGHRSLAYEFKASSN
ncbi:hypothetical protein Scep_007812 [Stephania cephalantha]|uniref:Uncharacterized protein n=1 Tax=Stephania cephalantha TaxID=152367 RepID=A0AAP0KD75_9MAGN